LNRIKPFVINRDTTRGPVYLVECEKYNSDRDNHLLCRVFLDIESAQEYQMELWNGEVANFDQFTDWSSTSIPAGKTVDDYIYRNNPNYVGWNLGDIVADGIMTDDDLSEMNWELDYGLTVGYRIVTLKWNAEGNRYG